MQTDTENQCGATARLFGEWFEEAAGIHPRLKNKFFTNHFVFVMHWILLYILPNIKLSISIRTEKFQY